MPKVAILHGKQLYSYFGDEQHLVNAVTDWYVVSEKEKEALLSLCKKKTEENRGFNDWVLLTLNENMPRTVKEALELIEEEKKCLK